MADTYYILQDGEKTGPFTYEELIENGLEFDTQLTPVGGDVWENAADRPEFFEYFEEKGFYFPTEDNLVGFGWRLLAYIADSFITSYPTSFFKPANFNEIYQRILNNTYTDSDMLDVIKASLLSFVVVALYHTVCEASAMQGSLGKKMFRLVVVDADGRRLSIGRALLRNAGKFVSGFVILIGYLSVLWDPLKQAWHDKWAKSYVLVRNR
jgi:uncharacterized RDD family membrane protein YckC